MEIWKSIIGYEGYYEVSNYGRVRSLDRKVIGRNGKEMVIQGKILKNRVNAKRGGYYTVALCLNAKYKYFYIHRLVLVAFVGEPPDASYQGAHNDGNCKNNNVNNLRWATTLENINDKKKHGTQLKGESHGASKLTDNQVIEIRAKYKRFNYNRSNSSELALEYNISKGNVWSIVNGKTFKHLPLGNTDY